MSIVAGDSIPTVILRLDRDRSVYFPGDTLSGEFRIEGLSRTAIEAVELTVLWFTEGKGTSDRGVHTAWQFLPSDRAFDPRRPQRFSTIVPRAPWSYEGIILKIRWTVRLRVILRGMPSIVCEVPFRLGDLPPVALP
ncbi:MAG: hypothetical protein NZ899_01705 [Thermoguttaceae bacterium]|nr:hypothetical protein [Thermoguttaceae bacterium]MDW8078651.1 hypothetical protein [Thermoguttaceae bacterium]